MNVLPWTLGPQTEAGGPTLSNLGFQAQNMPRLLVGRECQRSAYMAGATLKGYVHGNRQALNEGIQLHGCHTRA